MKKLLILLVVLLVVTGCTTQQTVTPEEIEVSYTVSPPTLMQEYEDNEVAADQKYKGKYVKLTGVVDSIGKTTGGSYITLDGGENFRFAGVQMVFSDKDEIDKIAKLNKGDTVTAIGKVDGKFVNVILKDSRFE